MAYKNREWLSWLKVIIISSIIAFGIRAFVFAPIIVDGPSMLPTLENDDHLIVNKMEYVFSDPDRFDIVVFHATRNKDYIKRVVGLPGEHIAYQNEILYINGQPYTEPFLSSRLNQLQEGSHYTHDFTLEDLPGEYEEIPDGHVLVLGDNRSNSTDSRVIGLIPIDRIVGVATFRYWPFNQLGLIH
ncbi:signal peptidase I [Salinibacillus xinjiangensis]|uniref:Signal peptidase I n=1 Tax=Salinibacillus xinjiangensis TaxID=1229268 RepID=A0A6G1X3G2_9BACI|nr:signal peptidase I [Salinibacillus xinjiangensis]MRG85420.1 signal peptidase I [Salinibacillus xinjiangensis]